MPARLQALGEAQPAQAAAGDEDVKRPLLHARKCMHLRGCMQVSRPGLRARPTRAPRRAGSGPTPAASSARPRGCARRRRRSGARPRWRERAEQQRHVDRVQRAEPRVGRRVVDAEAVHAPAGGGALARPALGRLAEEVRGERARPARRTPRGRRCAAGTSPRRAWCRRAPGRRAARPARRAARPAAARRRASAAPRRACRATRPRAAAPRGARRPPRPASARVDAEVVLPARARARVGCAASGSGGECRIARANRPSAAGETSRSATHAAPADWPPSVTARGVAAERADLALHPLEHRELVEQPPVPERPAERAEPVAERHHHHLRRLGERGAVVDARAGPADRRSRRRSRTRAPATGRRRSAASRRSGTGSPRRRAGSAPTRSRRSAACGCGGGGPKATRVELARPRLDRRRRRPAPLADRRGGVRDAEERAAVAAADAAGRQLNDARFGPWHRRPRSVWRRRAPS